jgi:tetratricopeptide (TPR) repeat protein
MKSTAIKKKSGQAKQNGAPQDIQDPYEYLAARRKFVRQHPKDREALTDYGHLLMLHGHFDAAKRAWRKLRKMDPSNANVVLEIGHFYLSHHYPDLAQEHYEEAARMDGKAINPRISLALLHERAHRFDQAREAAQQCLQIDPADEQALYISALLTYREAKLEGAESQLRDLISSDPKHEFIVYASRYLLAEILDRSGRFDEAMRQLSKAKAFIRKLPFSREAIKRMPSKAKRDAMIAPLREHPKNFGSLAEQYFPKQIRNKIPRFAYLAGNPRSGTTLLESILGAHPQIAAADEPEMSWLAEAAVAKPGGTAQTFNFVRRHYIELLRRNAGNAADGKLLLEKNPAKTPELCHLLKLFPEVKVITALRDPRDVVISLHFQNIPLNNVRFHSLEAFATAYAELMDFWLIVRQWEGFSWTETRYEDMVSDTKKEGRRVTEFLGLRWHKNQEVFFDAAKKRRLYAPTYHDVTKPIYSTSVGRWRNYEKYLKPVLPILEPYCRVFGYS